jgi:type IV secretion system protein VirB10
MAPPVAEMGDPRLEAMFAPASIGEASARPTVAVSKRGTPAWVFAVGAAIAALLLFWALGARRITQIPRAPEAESTGPSVAPPPVLYIPPEPAVQQPVVPVVQVAPSAVAIPAPVSVPAPQGKEAPRYGRPAVMPTNVQMGPPPPSGPVRGGGGPTVVIDAAPTGPQQGGQAGSMAPGSPFGGGSPAGMRTRASSLASPAQTVAQGAVIPAVLETAFNSTQAGFARAIVSRDVRSFDGSRVLIPRGSRLIGEYKSEVGAGQNRAIINWTRLIRGDGVTINLNSPAVDPLGRGGVRARVNDHLFEKVTNGLLQTIFSVASNLALSSRQTNVILAPGATSTPVQTPESQPMRTLTVAAGTTISVFVAHDLEFSAREAFR